MASKTLKIGDRVKWNSNNSTAEGQVIIVAVESGRIGDFVYDASRDYPRYIVETDEGKRAAHRAEALSYVQSGQA